MTGRLHTRTRPPRYELCARVEPRVKDYIANEAGRRGVAEAEVIRELVDAGIARLKSEQHAAEVVAGMEG